MERRNFMKLASASGLALVSPAAWGGKDLSAGRPNPTANSAHDGPIFLNVHAGGGWDPTHHCDPKVKSSETDPDPMTNLLASDIETVSGISFPGSFNPEIYGVNGDGVANGTGITNFFRKYAGRMTVLNGLDMQTNGHDSGTRAMWSGNLAEGFPTLSAYLAATYNPTLPMAFMSFGGYGETAGVAPGTRAGNIGVLQRIAYPTRSNPDDEFSTYHSSRALELIDEAQYHRDNALIEGQGLPKLRAAMSTLYTARSGSNELKLLQQYLPEDLAGGSQGQAQVAMAAFRAGISVSANISAGGFDTHGNHDASQIPALDRIFNTVDFAIMEAERQGLADRLVVMIGSDFGRTPGYNDGNGKDHWSINSAIFIGAGIQGGRVVGRTNEEHRGYGLDPNNLSVIEDLESEMKVNPSHLHANIREKFAFGAENPLAAMFPTSNTETYSII